MHCFLNTQNNTWIKSEEFPRNSHGEPTKGLKSSYLPRSLNAGALAPLTSAKTSHTESLRFRHETGERSPSYHCRYGWGSLPPRCLTGTMPGCLQPAFSRCIPPPMLMPLSGKLFQLLHPTLAACPAVPHPHSCLGLSRTPVNLQRLPLQANLSGKKIDALQAVRRNPNLTLC